MSSPSISKLSMIACLVLMFCMPNAAAGTFQSWEVSLAGEQTGGLTDGTAILTIGSIAILYGSAIVEEVTFDLVYQGQSCTPPNTFSEQKDATWKYVAIFEGLAGGGTGTAHQSIGDRHHAGATDFSFNGLDFANTVGNEAGWPGQLQQSGVQLGLLDAGVATAGGAWGFAGGAIISTIQEATSPQYAAISSYLPRDPTGYPILIGLSVDAPIEATGESVGSTVNCGLL